MQKLPSLFISALLLFSTKLITQQKKIEFGIKGGANYSQYTPRFPISAKKEIRFTRKVSYYFEAFANIRISEKLRIQPSLIYALQESKFKN